MINNMQLAAIEFASRRFTQSAGYAFVLVVVVLLLTCIFINPTLP